MADNWYTSRERVKRALAQIGGDHDALLDDLIAEASADIEKACNRAFYPENELRNFSWPQPGNRQVWVLALDKDLISVDSNGLTKEGDDATIIAAADFLIEPQAYGPPYHRIEIDRSGTAFFGAKDTAQRAIRVTGEWGYSADTVTAGAIDDSGGIDATVTTLEVSDASLVDVGDLLLIEAEKLQVTEKATKNTTATLSAGIAATSSVTTVPVDDGTKVKKGEVIEINSERMLVRSVNANNLSVDRAWDGTVLAAHSSSDAVFAFRSCTVTRGENGSTAATHDDAKAIAKYQAPPLIRQLARAEVVGHYTAEKGGWTGVIGAGDRVMETRMQGLAALRERAIRKYQRRVIGSV